MDYRIVILKIGNREGTAQSVQGVLTKYGCLIKVRLGLHNLPPESCSPLGLVLMEVTGEDSEIASLVRELNEIPEAVAKLVEL
jgi:hypothetical protein